VHLCINFDEPENEDYHPDKNLHMNMNWIGSKLRLPDDGEQVLTFVRGNFRVAIFSKASGGFKMHDESFLWIESEEVFWTKLIPPSGMSVTA
jgi:hypothetical protein